MLKKFFCALSIIIVLSVLSAGASFAATAEGLIQEALAALTGMSHEDDARSMAKTLNGAYAVAIVPSFVKAGFVLGGSYGEGLILKREKGKWYGPSFYNIGGGSFGLQIGVQDASLFLVVINRKGVDAFLSSKTKLGGELSVAAGPVGRTAQAATDAQMKASIYSYSMTRGLFAGVALDGSVISISVKRNDEYWKGYVKKADKDGDGKVSAKEALMVPAADKRIRPLTKALDEFIKKAK
ncbi:MAG: lipid-binding SYLF domain-containing protein [Fretibacterium sp.]|nr:lipid-binding SYLF domain-containing protein [Fretibacterium sp.]